MADDVLLQHYVINNVIERIILYLTVEEEEKGEEG